MTPTYCELKLKKPFHIVCDKLILKVHCEVRKKNLFNENKSSYCLRSKKLYKVSFDCFNKHREYCPDTLYRRVWNVLPFELRSLTKSCCTEKQVCYHFLKIVK
ncbi:hypothetical protein CHUAL_013982 [Chamberlinius hualienensis]